MSKIKCCKGCEERHPNCWSECEKYIEARKKLDEENAKIREEKSKLNLMDEYARDAKWKAMKRR